MANGNQLTREEQAWLVEYQACQQDANSNSSTYWTMAGIFIGISSVLLGGLLYGFLANIQAIRLASANACALRTIIVIVGAGMIFILLFLHLWLKRVTYLSDEYYDRMCEIEIQLGMQRNLRVRVLDEWSKIHKKEINERWDELKKAKSIKRLPEESVSKLDQMKEELVQFCNRFKPQHWYEKPSRYLHFPVILYILIVVWIFSIVIGLVIIN
jgi:hypothetical protein